MNFLLDTCVVSELVKKAPNIEVVNWFNSQQLNQLFISSITIAEINKGLLKIQASASPRYVALQQWLDNLRIQYSQRILPIADPVLEQWAIISACAELQGKKLAVMDSLIAATALHYQLILATRNVADFNPVSRLTLVNPFNPFPQDPNLGV